jgi:hypothetical protein
VFTLGLALNRKSCKSASSMFHVQPVVESLSGVCQSYLAMEKENKRLAADLAEARSKCNLHTHRLVNMLEFLMCGHWFIWMQRLAPRLPQIS